MSIKQYKKTKTELKTTKKNMANNRSSRLHRFKPSRRTPQTKPKSHFS